MKNINTGKNNKNSGISLIELIIVVSIMAILVGVVSPMFVKYLERSKKSRDIYTADQIARAVNIAFVENPDAYDAYEKWKGSACKVSVMENGTLKEYTVYRVASNGTQDTNKKSNCFNGGQSEFKKENGKSGSSDGSTGFYGVINRELGLSTTEKNSAIDPRYTKGREGAGVKRDSGAMEAYADLDRWRIVKRADNGQLEIWASQANPNGGYPIYRVWPEPDDVYKL